MRPFDPRLLSHAKATTRFIIGVVALALLGSLATIGVAYGLSQFIVGIFLSGENFTAMLPNLNLAVLAALARAVVLWLQEYAGAMASAKVKLELRAKALESIESQGSSLVSTIGSGPLSQLLGTGLDSLDVYFTKFIPQLIYTGLVTPAYVLLIFSIDLESAIALVATIPLIPLFMVMIGLFTQQAQQQQQDSLSRLNGHFLEILRGATTLKIFNRIPKQLETLRTVSEDFRIRTMRVLRISFLSGFALELAASLSVALIAVSIGLRLVSGNLDLATGLFILLLAPEVFLPLRMVGSQYHAASEGVEVAKRVLDIIELKKPVSERSALEPVPGELIVVTGPSGAGKTSLLEAFARAFPGESAWMPQKPVLRIGSILQNISGADSPDRETLQEAITISSLGKLDLETVIGPLGEGLSGGQKQRVVLARTIYNLRSRNKKTLLLDEPTSSLDIRTQKSIVREIKKLAADGCAVVVISHQKSWIHEADFQIEVGDV